MKQQEDLKNNQAQQTQQANLLAAQQAAQLQAQQQQAQQQQAQQQQQNRGGYHNQKPQPHEQKATMAVRKVIGRLGGATESNFEALRAEIDAVLQKELPNCGA